MKRILCFGDSNTYGYDPRSFFGDRYDAQNRWTDLLSVATGRAVFNAVPCRCCAFDGVDTAYSFLLRCFPAK